MVISLKSFLEDFVTITWIVHAVQRKTKGPKIFQGLITEPHTQVGDAGVCGRQMDGERAVHVLLVSQLTSRKESKGQRSV